MRTKGGFIIQKFRKLKKPISNGNLEPFIYTGFVKKITMPDGEDLDMVVLWDKLVRCANHSREDCFIEVPKIRKSITNI